MDKIDFKDGTKVSPASVVINGTTYTITPAVYSGATPLSSYILNLLQTNVENAINATETTLSEKISTNITNINTNSNSIDTIKKNFSDVYDNTKTYTVGDYCIYNNQLYKCSTEITVAEEFDSTKWTITSLAEILKGYADSITITDNTLQLTSNGVPIGKSVKISSSAQPEDSTALYINGKKMIWYEEDV